MRYADKQFEVSKTIVTFIDNAKSRGEDELSKAKASVEEASRTLQDLAKSYGFELSKNALQYVQNKFKDINSQYGVIETSKQLLNNVGEVVEGLDAKYKIVENVSSTYSSLDKNYNITGRAQNIVEVVDGYTGGRASDGVELAKQGLENSREFYSHVRKESGKEDQHEKAE